MSEGGVIYLVALLGWLVLAWSGYRSYQLGTRKTLTMILIWAAIFAAVALIFGAMA